MYKHIRNKSKAQDNLHPLLDAVRNTATKDEEKADAFLISTFLRYLMPSWPQYLIVRPVFLQVSSTLSWKTGMGSSMKPP